MRQKITRFWTQNLSGRVVWHTSAAHSQKQQVAKERDVYLCKFVCRVRGRWVFSDPYPWWSLCDFQQWSWRDLTVPSTPRFLLWDAELELVFLKPPPNFLTGCCPSGKVVTLTCCEPPWFHSVPFASTDFPSLFRTEMLKFLLDFFFFLFLGGVLLLLLFLTGWYFSLVELLNYWKAV